jgi:hypothetical protein
MFNEHLQVGSSDAVLIWAIFLFLGDRTGIKVYRFSIYTRRDFLSCLNLSLYNM